MYMYHFATTTMYVQNGYVLSANLASIEVSIQTCTGTLTMYHSLTLTGQGPGVAGVSLQQ